MLFRYVCGSGSKNCKLCCQAAACEPAVLSDVTLGTQGLGKLLCGGVRVEGPHRSNQMKHFSVKHQLKRKKKHNKVIRMCAAF